MTQATESGTSRKPNLSKTTNQNKRKEPHHDKDI